MIWDIRNMILAVNLQITVEMAILQRYKDIKVLMPDLKRVYAAPSEETAIFELKSFEDKWKSKYPKIAILWRSNWPNLSTYFKYPQ